MLKLATFGGLRLEGGDGSLKGAAGQRRPLALLALLAGASERGLSRDKIAAYLWPDSEEERARGSLKQTLYILRRDLGAEELVVGTTLLRLNPDVIGCDCWEFDAALARGDRAAAVGLYAGPFLDGFFVPGAPEFERWTSELRADFAHRAYAALRTLAVEAATVGHYSTAVELRRRIVAMDPLDARATLDLMTTMGAAGDAAGAIRQARIHEQLLRSQLDAPPHPEVVALANRLRSESAGHVGTAPKVDQLRASNAPPLPHVSSAVPAALAADAVAAAPVAPQALPPAPATIEQRRPEAPSPDLGAPRPPSRPRRRLVLLTSSLLAALLVIMVGARLGQWRQGRTAGTPPAGDGEATVAVLPFAVRGDSGMQYLRDGLATLLSANLDGAAELRSVEPRAVIDAAGGLPAELTPGRARGIAGRFGASLFVLGDVTKAGDQVRLTAQLYDRSAPDKPQARAAVEGPASDLFTLADELAIQLLASRLTGARDRLARTAAMTTRSVPALKGYLDGERELRAGHHAEAMVAFQRAVAEDSAFALAYYRLSTAADWTGRMDLARSAAEAAVRHRDRLSEQDAHLAEGYLALRRGELDDAERLFRDVLDDRPDDVEAWFRLGDLLFHGNPLRGRSATEARPAFVRVLQLDPDDGEALMHLARIAFLEGRGTEADTLVKRLLALTPRVDVLEMRAFRAFALADPDAQKRVTRELMRSQGDGGITPVSALQVAIYLDDLVGVERFATALTQPVRSRDVRAAGFRMLAVTALARGQWGGAHRYLDQSAVLDSTAALEYRAVLAALPFVPVPRGELEATRAALEGWRVADTVGAPSHTAAHVGLHGIIRLHRLGLVSARLGDVGAALRHAAELERATGSPDQRAYARTLARSVRAHAAIAAGRPAEALQQLEAARWEQAAPVFESEALDRFTRAELLRRVGRADEALGWYEAMAQRAAYELVYLAPAELAQAELYTTRGDRARAVQHYERFIALWKDCDPLLRPAVDEARQRLAAID